MVAAFRERFPGVPIEQNQDEGENHYYFVERRLPSRSLEERQQ
jgi:hypothetical protein